MKYRLQNRLIKKAGIWAVKQILTSLPFIGIMFKAIFFAMELLAEVQQHIGEAEAEPVPQFAVATA
jgi:hypothetical protein